MLALRLPFLHQAIQGDDVYYLAAAEHGQIDPLHPQHAHYLFLGDLADMRGFPHPPLNSWILTGLLAAIGDIREVPFHAAYTLFSLIAVLSMWSLARRLIPDRAFWATLLFLAVPAFVVNGNSFESDLPFLAFWMASIALFLKAVDERSMMALAGSAIAGALAGLAAYQAILLTPVLAAYLWPKRRDWMAGWAALCAAPVALGLWQIFELWTGGVLPAAMLAGYMHTYAWQRMALKIRNAAAMIVHTGWVVSPLIVVAAFWRGPKWRWVVVALACAAGAIYDVNPLCWASIGVGVLILLACRQRGYLEAWTLIFFAGAVVFFFAGSARYLLPIAAPIAMLAARSASLDVLSAGFAIQMSLSIGLATVNNQHWDAYRAFANSLSRQVAEHRGPGHQTWINGEWGLRYYFEAEGALPMPKDQPLRPGDLVISSALALPLPASAPLTPIAQTEIRPTIPLRLISLDRKSAYSVVARGLLPFEISTAPIDRIEADVVMERKPQLGYIDPQDPKAAPQILGGLYPDGWTGLEAKVVLKRPSEPTPLRAQIFIPAKSPARRITLFIDGRSIASETFPGPGVYTLLTAVEPGSADVTVTLTVDKIFSAPPDTRKLGIVIMGIGFRP